MTGRRQPLLSKLRQAQQRLALMALLIACVTLSTISFLTLRAHVEQNLHLVARSIAYSAQAAVVFKDSVAAQETLSLIAQQEGSWRAELFDAQGKSLAHYQRSEASHFATVLNQIGGVLFTKAVSEDVVQDGVLLGRVSLSGDFSVYLRFFLEMLSAIAVCLALIVLASSYLTRRFEQDIVRPINQLASLTRSARSSRSFEMRAAPVEVLEIHALGEDFNALLGEIHGHERELLARQKHLQAANDELSHQVFHDGLTGLPNRAHFMGRLSNALAASGPGQAMLAVMYIDCDHFKHINDTLGHAAGDEILIEFAYRMRAHLREGDAIARIGGDEFAAMLSPLRSMADAEQIASKIVEALAQPIVTRAAGPVRTSATVGVAVFPDHGDSLDGLLRCADIVMYRAKRQQRGIFVIANANDVALSQTYYTGHSSESL